MCSDWEAYRLKQQGLTRSEWLYKPSMVRLINNRCHSLLDLKKRESNICHLILHSSFMNKKNPPKFLPPSTRTWASVWWGFYECTVSAYCNDAAWLPVYFYPLPTCWQPKLTAAIDFCQAFMLCINRSAKLMHSITTFTYSNLLYLTMLR